ncbi:AzlC family ABC transporter permease [Nonomuraea glycinis]|jgi:predicted branched-subunit amino acid permease|uniref:Branched-chain amino acid ABC transporter permease n=1 Tax=Nonomuraea glycinis TaxID=2047744 RepID=A0A918A549_9ACTN|nr:AzlC family ABC transporter permease [Nonomuraea glycinis]MCA2178772.1 AzlC family ABC transporter permease [Nonomuraea glycinis]WSG65094.1 AzlC family ABC transporter permease [Nonomuraea glycinis]GGP08011.1 branched-chain amino acid ABC transporter permease [Nonomuraea glycinis]
MDQTTHRSAAIRDGLGVGLAVGLSGVAFGAAAVTAGLSVPQACVLSLLAFTGASQFALTGAVGAGGDLLSAASGALLLGGRNTLYGLRMADVLRVRGPRRLVAAHGVIDETTAVALAQPTPAAARAGFTTTFATIYITWNLTTLAGALGTSALGDPAMLGLDVVGPATFLAILWPRLAASAELRRLAVGGMAIALLATPFFPPGVPVLLSALAVLVVLVR